MSFRVVLIAALLLLSASVPAWSEDRPTATDTIRVSMLIEKEQVTIEIELPAGVSDTLSLQVSTWAGVDDYYRDFGPLQAVAETGEALTIMTPEPGRWLVAASRQPCRLSYTVSNSRKSFMGQSRTDQFHVALFDSWMFAWGYGLLVRVDDSLLNQLPVTVQVSSPTYGPVFSSRDFTEPIVNLDALSETVFAAGDYHHKTDTIFNTRVDFMVQRTDWAFAPDEFFAAVRGILVAQAEMFGFYPTERMLIVLNEGQKGSTGGSVIEDAIALSADPNLPLARGGIRTLQTIAHENIHVWNGNHIHPEESRPEGYHKWFSEGITDYYAWLTLYRTGVLTDSAFIASLNSLAADYFRNPHAATATCDTLAEKYWADNDYRTLPYRKGALLGLLFDLSLRAEPAATGGLDSLMRNLLNDSTIRIDGYDEDRIRERLERISGHSWEEFFDKYVTGASSLPFDSVLTAAGVAVARDTVTVFDLGLELEPAPDGKRRRVISVRAGSGAEKAGVRREDILTGWSYNTGNPGEPASLTIMRDSVAREISYLAARPLSVLQIDATPLNEARLRELLIGQIDQ